MEQSDQLNRMRHSAAHLLAMAVLKLRPKAKLGIGPVIDNGFYYDFEVNPPLTMEDLPHLEQAMSELIGADFAFERREVSREDAKRLVGDQPYKHELIDALPPEEVATVYQSGGFTDLCRGPHVGRSGEISSAFKLTSLAGAYWRGDERRAVLTRIYGVLLASPDELSAYLRQLDLAKDRDHRKLGKELGLFTIIDNIGPGLPLFYPKGAVLRSLVEGYVERLQTEFGYEAIWIPHISKGELYRRSGHLDKYPEMYPPMRLAGEADYYLKPMNCPHFMMLYQSTPRSYRHLPVRWTCITTNYRHEKSGELAGLTRVRALTQDDCHVFLRPDQIGAEIDLMLDMVGTLYRAFGFDDFRVRVSTRDPSEPGRYIGEPAVWAAAEETLAGLIRRRGWRHEVGMGEATFYGPKLDFMIKDALGREWQLSTIQLDMNLPKRFDLTYTDSAGALQRPVVIHRAILGSTERFLGIMIEHYGGDFPLWLAPVQVAILPVSEKFLDYARLVEKKLKAHAVRTWIDVANESVAKKIRQAEGQKYPIVVIVGQQEAESATVSVRLRHVGDTGRLSVEKFLASHQFGDPK